MSDIVIREATDADLQATSDVLDAAWSQFDELAGDEPSFLTYRASVPDVWSRLDEGMLLVAERQGEIIGTVHYYPPRAELPAGEGWPIGWASFRLLGVHPEARGLGVGRLLAEECVRRARADGAPVLGLHTSEWMWVARDMYERMGFARHPEMDFRPRPDFVVTAYRLVLDADGADGLGE